MRWFRMLEQTQKLAQLRQSFQPLGVEEHADPAVFFDHDDRD